MNVRQVVPKLGFIRFSRTDKLLLSSLKENSKKPDKVCQIFAKMSILKNDCLALLGPESLPADLENIFSAAEKLALADFPMYHTLFLKELNAYVKAIGLATYLAYDDAPRILSPLVACNFMVGDLNAISQRPLFLNCNFAADEDESVQRGFFADDYDYLCGRLILLTGRVQGQPLGPLSLSLFIAHEVACIKLVEQALQSGLIKKNDYQDGDLANLNFAGLFSDILIN